MSDKRKHKKYKKKSNKGYSNKPIALNNAKQQSEPLDKNKSNIEESVFQELLKKGFMSFSDIIIRPRDFDSTKVSYGWPKRPIDMPPLCDLSQMAADTYRNCGIDIKGYTLITKTPTVSFFQIDKSPNVIIIALRGILSRNINDINATLSIIRGIVSADTGRNLRNSQRYINDAEAVKNFQKNASRYLPHLSNQLVYYAVGFSLSGAIVDEFLEEGLVESAVSFNPAVERRNFAINNNNHRVYLECDLFLNLFGKFISNGNLEISQQKNSCGSGVLDIVKGSMNCHLIKSVIKSINENINQE